MERYLVFSLTQLSNVFHQVSLPNSISFNKRFFNPSRTGHVNEQSRQRRGTQEWIWMVRGVIQNHYHTRYWFLNNLCIYLYLALQFICNNLQIFLLDILLDFYIVDVFKISICLYYLIFYNLFNVPKPNGFNFIFSSNGKATILELLNAHILPEILSPRDPKRRSDRSQSSDSHPR